MYIFKFGQKEIAVKDFHRERKVTDILTINVNKAVASDRVSWNKTSNIMQAIKKM